jgi:hypothetical protein
MLEKIRNTSPEVNGYSPIFMIWGYAHFSGGEYPVKLEVMIRNDTRNADAFCDTVIEKK